jgi:hypothetical protein
MNCEEAMADYIGCDCDEKDVRIAKLEGLVRSIPPLATYLGVRRARCLYCGDVVTDPHRWEGDAPNIDEHSPSCVYRRAVEALPQKDPHD